MASAANNTCGSPVYDMTIPVMPFDVSSLSIVSMKSNTCRSHLSLDCPSSYLASTYEVNYADFDYPIPYSAYKGMSACNLAAYPRECETMSRPYEPYIALPSWLTGIDPAWQNCTAVATGVWDPPIALTPEATIQLPVLTAPAEISIPQTTAQPSRTAMAPFGTRTSSTRPAHTLTTSISAMTHTQSTTLGFESGVRSDGSNDVFASLGTMDQINPIGASPSTSATTLPHETSSTATISLHSEAPGRSSIGVINPNEVGGIVASLLASGSPISHVSTVEPVLGTTSQVSRHTTYKSTLGSTEATISVPANSQLSPVTSSVERGTEGTDDMIPTHTSSFPALLQIEHQGLDDASSILPSIYGVADPSLDLPMRTGLSSPAYPQAQPHTFADAPSADVHPVNQSMPLTAYRTSQTPMTLSRIGNTLTNHTTPIVGQQTSNMYRSHSASAVEQPGNPQDGNPGSTGDQPQSSESAHVPTTPLRAEGPTYRSGLCNYHIPGLAVVGVMVLFV